MRFIKIKLLVLFLTCGLYTFAATPSRASSGCSGSFASTGGSGTPLTCTITETFLAGDAIVCGVGDIGGATISTVTDGLSTTYSNLGNHAHFPSLLITAELGTNTNSGSSVTVTITLSGNDNGFYGCAHYTGTVASSLLDGSVSFNDGFGGTISPGSVTTTNANDAVIGFIVGFGEQVTAGSGFTIYQSPTASFFGTTSNFYAEDQIVASSGSWTPNWVETSSGPWSAMGLAIKGTSSGVTKKCTITLLGVGVC